jgi:tyrosine-protein kinase
LTADATPVSTLHDYLRVLRRRKWIVVPAVLIAPLVAILISLRQPIRYEASAQVLVNRQNLPANITGVNDPTQLDSSRLLTTQAQFARLPMIARRTLKAAGITGGSASDLLGASRVTAADNSDFLTFTVSDPERSLAIRLATAYAHQYVAARREFETAQLRSANQSVHQKLQQLKEQGATDSRLYASLLDRADQLAAMEAVAAGSRQSLVRDATGAGEVGSHVVRNGVLALLLGLIAGVGLAFLRDALDQRSRSADEIGGHLDLRLLGRLPEPARSLRRQNQLAMLAEPESPYAEPFRMLRNSLDFVLARRPAAHRSEAGERQGPRLAPQTFRRLMVTSAIEGEGKSTTVANLAVAFAVAGRKVTLVDLDFRRPSLHRFFGLHGRPGLTDVVLRSVPLTEALCHIRLDTGLETLTRGNAPTTGRLDFLPLGALPPHGGDVALAVGLEQLLGQLASDADLVLIDAPPLLRVGDALALTSYVDGLLVVTSLHTVRPTMLDELRRVLDDCPAEKLGFILTGADLEGGYEYLTHPYDRALHAG